MPDTRSSPPSHVHDAGSWLSQKTGALRRERSRNRSIEMAWSWARLISFALAVAAIILLGDHAAWAAIGLLAAGGLFVFSISRHVAWRARRELSDAQLLMLEESLRRHGGAVVLVRSHERPMPPANDASRLDVPGNDGPVWSLTDQELDDLDLYALPVGVFGLLNRTSTAYGARRLADMLDHPSLSVPHIAARQSAVRWMAESPDARTRMMAAVSVLRGQDTWLERFTAAVRGAAPLNYGMTSLVLRIWSLITLLASLYFLSKVKTAVTPYAYLLLGLLLVNGAVFELLRRRLKQTLDPWRETARAAAGLLTSARHAAIDLPQVESLAPLQRAFAAAIAPPALPALCRRLPWTDSGGAMHIFLNAMFFYDLHLAETILAHAIPHRDALLRSLAALAELEAISSLACFAWEQPATCYPTFVTDHATRTPALAIRAGRHPLINPAHVVPNDLHLHAAERMWVITGSNMAGKSTFLRMAALNTLFAQIGGACCAESVTLSPLRLISDLRARDNLAREESYFLAEVRHLRRLVDSPPGDAPVFGLIDEPFRGTNSQERLAASLAVVEHVIGSTGLYLVATHEQRLTELARPAAPGAAAANYHFQEKLGEDGTVFDYHILPGPATTRNALRVLAHEGYPRELLDRADHWLKETQQ